ncbi:ulp1 protease family, C-terminal catalytic domain-containing protein [Artemisia annua]|uniref:Ulp1 protease family, C-terminal catalytic domain-containing protein n=1 Tax=Artemisia annua TaxID=35608 RepID=A0A2U1MXK3_ARTAN|nr:ulp1 protease family, C-terminal catalytic domain-containing protein [Artemisia annua]
MANLKRKGGDDTPVRRSDRIVYQKDSDDVDFMGVSSKTKAPVRRSCKLVYQEDVDDDDFVDEPPKLKNIGPKNGNVKDVRVKAGDKVEVMDRVQLRIPPISLFRVITNFTEEQKQSVREMGFGGILEYRLSEIPTRLGYWVLDKFDEDSCSLLFGGNTIPVTREAVHEILGIPMGIIPIDALKRTSRSDKLTKSWKNIFGGKIGKIYHSNVEDIIHSQKKGGWVFKITFLVLLFTAMGQSNMCSTVNLRFLLCILGEEHIIHLDWCTYMIECLILYVNSTKSLTQNVERITPAITFWTSIKWKITAKPVASAIMAGTWQLAPRKAAHHLLFVTTDMANLKRKGGDDTPVRRSDRIVYQKDSDDVDFMGVSSKTKVPVRRSCKLVYQEDVDDDDFVDEPPKLKNIGSKNGNVKDVRVKAGDKVEVMDRVQLRIPPISLFRVITNFTEEQKQSVREMGFGGILEYRLSEIPTRLGYWVLDKFDEDSCSLIFGGNTIPVTREAVHEILGIPMGIIPVDALKRTSRSDKLTKSWKNIFGGKIGKIYHSNVEDIIHSQKKGGWMFKITFLVLLFTAMGQSNMCSTVNLRFLPCILGEEHIIHLDWCTYMIECLVNTKRSWNRSTHYNGPLVMLLDYTGDNVLDFKCLNTRESEEIASGGFGIHEEGAQRGNEDCEKQNGETEIPSTQIAVKLEIDEEGVENDGYNPFATQTLIDELSTPHLLDGDEGLYPILADGMFSKYGTERPPQNLKESIKYVACKLKMADLCLNEADICLKDAIKENPNNADLKELLKLRNEMCDTLDINECKTPKDNMEGKKVVRNTDGNLECGMLSFTQEAIELSDQVMSSRKSGTQIKKLGRGMLLDGPSFDLNLTVSPATKGKALAGPKYDSQPTSPSTESYEYKTPVSNLANVSGTRSKSSSIISVKTREPKPLNVIIPNIFGATGKDENIPVEVFHSPYTRKACSVDDGITYDEKWVADCIFTGRFTPTDIVFETHFVAVPRSVFESLYPGIRVASGAIDVFTHVLNYAEQFRQNKHLRRVFCNTSMVSEKMLCDDWDDKVASDVFIQNMRNVLRSTFYQRLKMVDLVFFPIIQGEHFYVICMNLKLTEIHILDNINSDEQNLDKRYGEMPRILTKLFEGYLKYEKHHHEGRMEIAECIILRMGCRTMRNFVDCGIFTMRHMETYREGKAQQFLLNDLRHKYVAKILLCDINMKKEEVESEREAYKSLSIGEKRRLSEDALATLMESLHGTLDNYCVLIVSWCFLSLLCSSLHKLLQVGLKMLSLRNPRIYLSVYNPPFKHIVSLVLQLFCFYISARPDPKPTILTTTLNITCLTTKFTILPITNYSSTTYAKQHKRHQQALWFCDYAGSFVYNYHKTNPLTH